MSIMLVRYNIVILLINTETINIIRKHGTNTYVG